MQGRDIQASTRIYGLKYPINEKVLSNVCGDTVAYPAEIFHETSIWNILHYFRHISKYKYD